jgi:ABC-type bacteriocin/lantibiotic exporter with double-glycine peptidase domain
MIKIAYDLWQMHLTSRRKIQFILIIILSIIAAFFEIISIGSIVPFLTVLSKPESVFKIKYFQGLFNIFHITTPDQLVTPIVICFGIVTFFSGVIRYAMIWSSTLWTFKVQSDLEIKIYRTTLYQPYNFHTSHNSSEIISVLTQKFTSLKNGIITPMITITSNFFIIVGIIFTLFLINPLISAYTLIGFISIYSVVVYFSRNILSNYSKKISNDYTNLTKKLQESFGGIRDILLDGSQEAFNKSFAKTEVSLRNNQANSSIIQLAPKTIIETLATLLFIFIAYSSKDPDGYYSAIPILGAFSFAALRLLPLIHQLFGIWATMKTEYFSVIDVLDFLNNKIPEQYQNSSSFQISFNSHILIENLSFKYNQNSPFTLNSINLNIPKGSRIGVVGKTGSGKSTLLDIIMGLLTPTKGKIKIDNVTLTEKNIHSWQSRIAHVPQNIFLTDQTVEENIAFGSSKKSINEERVKYVSQMAKIADDIISWPKQYKTNVGERGVLLSGGQRQRIGIARALYKEADVLIFDEATNALDTDTETSVMETIENLPGHITMFIIAHRISTLKSCNFIIEVDSGTIKVLDNLN